METVIAALLGALAALGCVLLVAGALRRVDPSRPSSTRLWTPVHNWWGRLPPRRRRALLGSITVGFVVALLTGWAVALLVVPLVVVAVPALLTEPPHREIHVLAALDRWVRLLMPSIATGKSIRDAIIATRSQAPDALRQPVNAAVGRMDHGWSTRDALLAMADDLSSADADAVLAALAIASSRGGSGTRATLHALAENTQERLAGLRQIATERAKPRAVVRQVTAITVVILGGAILLGGQFFDPYQSPLGQLIAAALAAAWLGSLAILRRRTTPAPAARFLRGTTA